MRQGLLFRGSVNLLTFEMDGADTCGDRDVAIIQVEYSNTAAGPLIHIFGRDPQRKAVQIQVHGFRPYFYGPVDQVNQAPLPVGVEAEQGVTYPSIRGEPLTRLYTRRPGDVREVRGQYRHFEADIPFATRFMIDAGLRDGVRTPSCDVDFSEVSPTSIDVQARVCFLDIECEDERGFPDPQRDAVICVTCHDSYDDHFTTLLLQAEGTMAPAAPVDPGQTLICFQTEQALFEGLIAYITEKDPDILSGWNIVDFDIPYLMNRMEHLRINSTRLSRLPGYTERNALRGRVLFDLLAAYKKMHPSRRESYRLDAVAGSELGETKLRYTGTISSLWRTDPATLVAYNLKDVALCTGIDQKDHIISFYREIARYVGCPLDKTVNSSNVIDIYILRKAFGKFILPSKGAVVAEEFEGATVFDPSRGVRENVVVLDLKSLYPMAMMTINASPETKDPEGELQAPNGVRFRAAPDGLTRSIISELLIERDDKKRLRNTFPFGSDEYLLYDLQQNALKVIMNSYYGVSGYIRFRLYDREIGAAVTAVGRAIIEHTRQVIEGMGYRVLYGDTDSCMIQLPPGDKEATIRTARAIEQQLNESYGPFSRTVLNAEKHYFSIKFEKIYQRFFQAGRKKRYAGHLVWKEGKDVDEIDIVGFEIKRSDSPQITRIVQQRVMEMILSGEEYPVVKTYLGDVIRRYRSGKYSLEEIGIPGGIGKQLDQYETDDAQVRGAKYSNRHLGTEFGKGSKPKRIYIKQVKGRFPKTDVLCFEYADQVPPEFVIDYETMLEKTIKQPITRIIEALGWNWEDVDPSRTTLAQFGF